MHVISAVSESLKDRVKAPEVMKRLGLRGGGRPDFAQGGGVAPGDVDALRRKAAEVARQMLEGVRCAERAAGALVARRAARSRRRPPPAQIYTRRNADGVMEATNAPEDHDFRLTYPGKGTLIHSRRLPRHLQRPVRRAHRGGRRRTTA